jgi:alpha-tubulin suppressor-like RCC1 family protein
MSQLKPLTVVALVLFGGCRDSDDQNPQLPTGPLIAPGPPELAAPTNLTTLAVSSGQIDISWQDNGSRETGFEVHRSTGGAASFALLTTVGANAETHSDMGLTPAELYCYQVRGVRTVAGSTTLSGPSNIACTVATPAPAVAFGSVSAGGAHTCALTTSGAAYCWGRGESGQLGVPSPPSTCLTDAGFSPCSMVPVAVGGGLTFTELAGGGAHTCGLTSTGSVYCWGDNASGQVGDNSTTDRSAPVAVASILTFASIDAGAQHTCALTGTGAAWCWGLNSRGQLGDGTTDNSSVPVAVSGGLTFQQIAAGGFFHGDTCGLANNGAAWCWGDNERGQLGIGSADVASHSTPAPVSGGLTFTQLTAGLGRHACGLTATGAAWCWGENTYGALGNRSRKDQAVPVPVFGGLSFTQIIAGGFIGHTCALTGGGAGYCWGENEMGAVGDGTTRDRTTPSAVAGGLVFLTIDAGYRHSCARSSTGTVYCWGANGAGQLGNNSNSRSSVPVEVFAQP